MRSYNWIFSLGLAFFCCLFVLSFLWGRARRMVEPVIYRGVGLRNNFFEGGGAKWFL